jgi:hypothetical protein
MNCDDCGQEVARVRCCAPLPPSRIECDCGYSGGYLLAEHDCTPKCPNPDCEDGTLTTVCEFWGGDSPHDCRGGGVVCRCDEGIRACPDCNE